MPKHRRANTLPEDAVQDAGDGVHRRKRRTVLVHEKGDTSGLGSELLVQGGVASGLQEGVRGEVDGQREGEGLGRWERLRAVGLGSLVFVKDELARFRQSQVVLVLVGCLFRALDYIHQLVVLVAPWVKLGKETEEHVGEHSVPLTRG